jgi:hypothetical protein
MWEVGRHRYDRWPEHGRQRKARGRRRKDEEDGSLDGSKRLKNLLAGFPPLYPLSWHLGKMSRAVLGFCTAHAIYPDADRGGAS